MSTFVHAAVLANPARVNGVLKNPINSVLRELGSSVDDAAPTQVPFGTHSGGVHGSGYLSQRLQLPVLFEYRLNDDAFLFYRHEPAIAVLVTQDTAAVEQAPLGPFANGCGYSGADGLPLELGKTDSHQLQQLARGRGRIEVLPDAHQGATDLAQRAGQVNKISHVTADAVELGHDKASHMPCMNIAQQSLKLGPVLYVLAGYARLFVHLVQSPFFGAGSVLLLNEAPNELLLHVKAAVLLDLHDGRAPRVGAHSNNRLAHFVLHAIALKVPILRASKAMS